MDKKFHENFNPTKINTLMVALLTTAPNISYLSSVSSSVMTNHDALAESSCVAALPKIAYILLQ